MKKKNDGATGCLGLILLYAVFTPYFMVCISITDALIKKGVAWNNAIIYGWIWPFHILDLVIDNILKFEMGR